VVSLGIAGSLDDGVAVGDVVVASASVFADEGAERPGGWETAADFGFPLVESGGVANGMGVGCDAGLVERVRGGLGGVCGVVHAGVIATVSVCSGTDGRRALTRERSGAVAEAMEGAAVGVASRLGAGVGFLEVRVISNRTGDEGAWDMAGAMAVLGEVAGRL
jgi:futalosine hydrolase